MHLTRQTASRIIRWIILGLSTAFFLFCSKVISEHAICPIGGFEMFFTGLFKTGFTLAGLFSGMVLIFLVMSVFSLIFRRAYCGYICPMGALQELFERIGKLVLPKKIRSLRIPPKADRILRWVKYPVLASFVVGAAITGTHWMMSGDPFIVMMNLFGAQGISRIWASFPYAVAFFFAILAFAFFFGRGFCKFICPAGAWYAILSKVSPTKIVRNESKCVDCGKCTKACPMNIQVAQLASVKSAECIGCQECVNACPYKGTLEMKTGVWTVPQALMPIAAAVIFTGSLAGAAAMPRQNGRPQGEQGGRGGSGTNAQPGFSPATRGAPSNQDNKVGFGGCANCTGCGLCTSVTTSAGV